MSPLWVLRFAALAGAILLTGAGAVFLLAAPPAPGLFHLLNPGALVTGWIWPEGVHSDAPLAAMSSFFTLGADLVLWWLVLYFAVLRPLLGRRLKPAD